MAKLTMLGIAAGTAMSNPVCHAQTFAQMCIITLLLCYNVVILSQGISLGQAFGWEAIMTFLLVVTIYSVAVGQPDFGVMGPLAIGLVGDSC